jgi:hypothetical protein
MFHGRLEAGKLHAQVVPKVRIRSAGQKRPRNLTEELQGPYVRFRPLERVSGPAREQPSVGLGPGRIAFAPSTGADATLARRPRLVALYFACSSAATMVRYNDTLSSRWGTLDLLAGEAASPDLEGPLPRHASGGARWRVRLEGKIIQISACD